MAGHTTDSSPQSSALEILVVEDDRVNQQLAVAVIEDSGHLATEAVDGEQAVEFVESKDFDLVLMDIEMPKMDGFTATRVIREREQPKGKRTPIVALTVSTGREPCIAAGMDDYLVKPINATELARTIDRIGIGPSEKGPFKGEHLRILLVEDSPVAARLAELCLKKGLLVPYSVETVDTLKAANECLGVEPIDLVLLDLNLPDSLGLWSRHR